jgi:hypothetical protein
VLGAIYRCSPESDSKAGWPSFASFIGSHTCKVLAAAGFLPLAFETHAEFVR